VTEQEFTHGAACRRAIIRFAHEVTGKVSATCRYFGIKR
jgi:hypothetical protein